MTLSGVGGKAVWFLLAPYRCDTKFKRACFHLGIHVGLAQLLLCVFVDRCAEKSECVGWGCLSESSDYAWSCVPILFSSTEPVVHVEDTQFVPQGSIDPDDCCVATVENWAIGVQDLCSSSVTRQQQSGGISFKYPPLLGLVESL